MDDLKAFFSKAPYSYSETCDYDMEDSPCNKVTRYYVTLTDFCLFPKVDPDQLKYQSPTNYNAIKKLAQPWGLVQQKALVEDGGRMILHMAHSGRLSEWLHVPGVKGITVTFTLLKPPTYADLVQLRGCTNMQIFYYVYCHLNCHTEIYLNGKACFKRSNMGYFQELNGVPPLVGGGNGRMNQILQGMTKREQGIYQHALRVGQVGDL